MKINEILAEAGGWANFAKGVGAVAGGVGMGIGKGLANAVAPGAVDKLNGLRYQKGELAKQTASQAPAPEIITKVMADLSTLAEKSNNTVTPEQIGAVLANYVTHTDKNKLFGEIKYMGARLANAGVNVPGLSNASLVSKTDTYTYDQRSKVLTISGPQGTASYRKLKTQYGAPNKWQDIHTDQEVEGDGAKELDTAFNKATGAQHVPDDDPTATLGSMAIPPNQELKVELNDMSGATYYKFPSGVWMMKPNLTTRAMQLSKADGAKLNAMLASKVKSVTRMQNPRKKATPNQGGAV